MQPAELLSGVIDFVRDALVLAVGADSMLLAISPRQRPQLKGIVDRWTVRLDPGGSADPVRVPRPNARQLAWAAAGRDWLWSRHAA